MEVNPSVPAKTVPEFIAYAKANPGKINMALPEIPTVGDFVPGYVTSVWYGIGAPKNPPAEIVGIAQ